MISFVLWFGMLKQNRGITKRFLKCLKEEKKKSQSPDKSPESLGGRGRLLLKKPITPAQLLLLLLLRGQRWSTTSCWHSRLFTTLSWKRASANRETGAKTRNRRHKLRRGPRTPLIRIKWRGVVAWWQAADGGSRYRQRKDSGRLRWRRKRRRRRRRWAVGAAADWSSADVDYLTRYQRGGGWLGGVQSLGTTLLLFWIRSLCCSIYENVDIYSLHWPSNVCTFHFH